MRLPYPTWTPPVKKEWIVLGYRVNSPTIPISQEKEEKKIIFRTMSLISRNISLRHQRQFGPATLSPCCESCRKRPAAYGHLISIRKLPKPHILNHGQFPCPSASMHCFSELGLLRAWRSRGANTNHRLCARDRPSKVISVSAVNRSPNYQECVRQEKVKKLSVDIDMTWHDIDIQKKKLWQQNYIFYE